MVATAVQAKRLIDAMFRDQEREIARWKRMHARRRSGPRRLRAAGESHWLPDSGISIDLPPDWAAEFHPEIEAIVAHEPSGCAFVAVRRVHGAGASDAIRQWGRYNDLDSDFIRDVERPGSFRGRTCHRVRGRLVRGSRELQVDLDAFDVTGGAVLLSVVYRGRFPRATHELAEIRRSLRIAD